VAHWWSPIDVDFHANDRVRAAGRNGREVFLVLLLLHKKLGGDGVIPADKVPGHRHLAARLMCSPEEAREGFESCADPSVGLIEIRPNGDVVILGWDDKWRGPKTSTDRVRRFRTSKQSDTPTPETELNAH
jgi:hypothetical protein